MGREIPLPNCHTLRCLQADDTIKDFMDKDFLKKTDDHYKRMQSALNMSVAQALNLQRDLEEQGCKVAWCLWILSQRMVLLVRNASNYISQCRHENVITKMEFRSKGPASVMKSVRSISHRVIYSSDQQCTKPSQRELKWFQPSKSSYQDSEADRIVLHALGIY